MTRRVLTVAPHPCIIRHSPYALNAERHGAPHGPSPQDQLRAGFAMSTRRLELSFEQLKTKTTSQLAEPRPSRPPIQQPKDGACRCRYSCRSEEMNDGEQSLRRRSWCCASRSMSCGGPRQKASPQQHRPIDIRRPLSAVPRCSRRAGDRQAGYRDPLAPRRVQSLLALESRTRGGRPKVPPEIRQLIRDMSLANPLWGAPRIHGELLKLGIDVGQTSVAKYMARRR